MRAAKQLAIVFAVLVVGVVFQNCSKVNFKATNDGKEIKTDTGGPNCHEVLNTITKKVKVIYVVDVSGSNDQTDPDQNVRAGSISRFYNSYSSKTNFGWNGISFSGTTAVTRLLEGDGKTVTDLVAWLNNHDDDGDTPYVASLDKTVEVINSIPVVDAETKYIVVFLSDGRPDPDVADDVLKKEVDDIVNTNPGRVSLNTVYYGPYSQAAADRLKMMAVQGGGNFLDANKNSTGNMFDIADLVIVPGEVCDPATAMP